MRAAATPSGRASTLGTIWVTPTSSCRTKLPWGGFKGSGDGGDLSIYVLDDYS